MNTEDKYKYWSDILIVQTQWIKGETEVMVALIKDQIPPTKLHQTKITKPLNDAICRREIEEYIDPI